MGMKGDCLKMKIYALIIRKEENTYYGEFKDIPCFISAKNMNELIEKAEKALKIYFSEMKITAQKIAEPTDYEIVTTENTNEMIIPITINVSNNNHIYRKEKLIKKNVTIPDWLNNLALKYKIPFSETLKTALIESIKNKIDSNVIH